MLMPLGSIIDERYTHIWLTVMIYIIHSVHKEIALYELFIRVSLSKPHTSGKNGMSVTFAKVYVEIRINGMSVMHLQKFIQESGDNLQMLPDKCSLCKQLPE